MAALVQSARGSDFGMEEVAVGLTRSGAHTMASGRTESEEEDSELMEQDSDSDWEEALKPVDDLLTAEERKALRRSVYGLYCMYFAVGLNYGFFSSYINIPFCQYVFGPLGQAGRTTVQQCNVSPSIITMPWNFKVFYGFFLDRVTFCGSTRKGWIIFGWAGSLVILLLMVFLTPKFVEEGHFSWYCMLCMGQCVFYMIADVAGDGMTIELTKLEDEEVRGTILTRGQMYRFSATLFINIFGLIFMNGDEYTPHNSSDDVCEAVLPNASAPNGITLVPPDCVGADCGRHDPGLMFSFQIPFSYVHLALFCFILPCFLGMILLLQDPPRVKTEAHGRKRDAFRLIWAVTKTKAMLFLILFSLGSLSIAGLTNPATNNVTSIAQPSTLQNSIGTIFGSLLFLIGVWIFKKYLMNWNWRLTYIWTSALTILQNCILLLIIYNAWGVAQDGWFFIFGTNILMIIQGIAQVLSSLAIAEIAPAALEATIYEFLTSIHNAAIALNTNLQNLFLPAFELNDISATTYFNCSSNPSPPVDDYNRHMAEATYFTIAVSVIGTICFAFLFPKDKEQTRQWRDDTKWHKKWVGVLSLSVGGFSFLFAIVISFLSLFPTTACLKIAGGTGCTGEEGQ